jgi:CheY-like chemotaxis protein
MTSPPEKSTILAVDDTPENLDVVKGVLGANYIVKGTTLSKRRPAVRWR